MRIIQSAVAAGVAACVAAATAASAQVSNAELAAVPRVTLAEFKKLHAAKQILAIDVRDPHAYENGHIPGALNVSFVDVEIMANRLLKEPKPIVAYCACKDEMTAARVADPADAGGREADPRAGRRAGTAGPPEAVK